MNPRLDRALTLLGALLTALLAARLRAPGLHLGWTGDEIANLPGTGVVPMFLDAETGVNPPLWRWLIHAVASGRDVLVAGRALSDACNVAAVALGVLVARRVGGRWWCGWLAGLLLAAHPWSVAEAPTARAYGLWTLLATLHLLALSVWSERGDRRSAIAVAVTAIVLPWTHYTSVPWLLLVGLGVAATVPGRRRLPLLYAPAALLSLPLLWRVLATTTRRETPIGTIADTLGFLLGLGLRTRAWPYLPAGLVVVVLIAVAVAWRRIDDRLRVAAWTALALPLSGALLHTIQYVRPTTAVMAVTVAAPLLAAAPQALRPAPARVVAAAIVAVGIALPLRQVMPAFLTPDVYREAVRAVATRLHEGTLPGTGAIVVHPRSEASVLYFTLTGRHVARALHDERCTGLGDCFVVRGRPILPRDDVDPGEEALVVSFARTPPSLPCTPTPLVPGATAWTCSGIGRSADR